MPVMLTTLESSLTLGLHPPSFREATGQSTPATFRSIEIISGAYYNLFFFVFPTAGSFSMPGWTTSQVDIDSV
ncbi:hypothetical protein BJX96DRAFT_5873 [Aspergillus floccosus]